MVNWDKPIQRKDKNGEYEVEGTGRDIENIPEPRLVSCTNYYPASPTSRNYVDQYSFKAAMRDRAIDIPGYNITVTELNGVYTIKLTTWNMAIAQGD